MAPEFLREYLRTLTEEQINELYGWVTDINDNSFEDLINEDYYWESDNTGWKRKVTGHEENYPDKPRDKHGNIIWGPFEQPLEDCVYFPCCGAELNERCDDDETP